MTVLASQIITDVRNELVEPVPGFWTDPELLRNINRAENDFVSKTYVLERQSFLQTQVGINNYPLPADCIYSRGVLFNEPSISTLDDGSTQSIQNWFRLIPTNLEKVLQERPDFNDTTTTNQGTPRRYWIWNNTLYMFPAPDTSNSGNLQIWYKAKPIPILTTSSPVNLDDIFQEAITAFVLWKAWAKEKETELANEQKAIYLSYIGEARKWVKKRPGDQKYRVDIESPVPFSNAGLGGVGGLSGGFNPFVGG